MTSEGNLSFVKVDYQDLNAKQREVYNFHCIAARLAQYGFASYPIRDDWNGGDMFARHMLNGQAMTIQIKGRATFDKKYCGQGIYIGFPLGDTVYVYPHDAVLQQYEDVRKTKGKPLHHSEAWSVGGLVHWKSPTEELLKLLSPYALEP